MTDSPIPAARYTTWQAIAVAVSLSTRALEELRAFTKAKPSGQLPAVTRWQVDRVYYEGDVVTHLGSCWQATKDTGRAPTTEDWLCLAESGTSGGDGASFRIRGTWAEQENYSALDVVACGGGSFVARHDSPGNCPGPDWQVLAMEGARGKRGDRGETGPPGQAAAIVRWQIAEYTAVPIMSDGSRGAALDLRALFEQYHREAAAE